MDYDPKLVKAMDEIKAILQRNDIAAMVILCNPPFSEVLNYLDTTWSCVKLVETPEGPGFRMRTRLQEDYAGNVEDRNRALDKSANMVVNFGEIGGELSMAYLDLVKQLKEHSGLTITGRTKSTRQDRK